MQNEITNKPQALNSYISPLQERYAGPEMSYIFSPQFKFSTWRRLWTALAISEKELGLDISEEQIEELRENIENIDFAKAEMYEKELHHDVMAHIMAYGDQCPRAKAIIHLGATSCYVTDNTEVMQMTQGMKLLIKKLKKVAENLKNFANIWSGVPCLGFTHFQPAQLTTVGKRAVIWLQDFIIDLEELTYRLNNMKFLGCKGATGTQSSFLSLFNKSSAKVKKLEELIAEKLSLGECFPISGQTYTRKQDLLCLNTLSSFGASAHKFATDIRLLAGLKELEEPFSKKQIGSSAMPYKRNPMLSERICSLSRFLISLSQNASYTQSVQWLERSLDDSANRRLSIAESFLTADAIASLLIKITNDINVNPKIIEKHIDEELPFIASENILMEAVKKGGDRQILHEKLRSYSKDCACEIKNGNVQNELLNKIEKDPAFNLSREEISSIVNVNNFIGRAKEQVDEFLAMLSH